MFVILGATGKVGRATIRELLAKKQRVRAVVRDASRGAELGQAGCEVVVADVKDAAALRSAFIGAQAVQVICPMLIHANDSLAEMCAIVDTLGVALEGALPPAVLAISDYGAEVEADTGVTLLFHQLEARLRRIATRLTLLRSAEQMQNWARYLRFSADTGVLPSMHHPLNKAFPTVAADDVGVAAADLLQNPSKAEGERVVHVEGPRRYSAEDVAEVFSSVLKREVRSIALPRTDWLSALSRAGVGESYAKLVVSLFDAHNAGKIGVEPGAKEVRLGNTELVQVVQSLHQLS